MTFKEYFKELQALYNDNPHLHDKKLVYAKDDEGNGYKTVHYCPQTGVINTDLEWESSTDKDETNTICIN